MHVFLLPLDYSLSHSVFLVPSMSWTYLFILTITCFVMVALVMYSITLLSGNTAAV